MTTSRSRLINPRSVRTNVSRALRKRRGSKVQEQNICTGEIIDFTGEEVVKPLLRGATNDPFRHGAFLHVSDLIYKCPRKMVLADRFNRPMHGRDIYDSSGLTFAMGNAIHDFVRNKIRDKHPATIYGSWSCLCKESKFMGTREQALEKGKCQSCKNDLNVYDEFQIRNETLKVIGHIDLCLWLLNALLLVEIKSINRAAFSELVRPIPEHTIQILLYWYFAREMGLALHDKVSILYTVKEWMFGNPYKEFVMQPSLMMGRLDDYLEDAASLREALDDPEKPIPARIICARENSPEARKCELATICFELD